MRVIPADKRRHEGSIRLDTRYLQEKPRVKPSPHPDSSEEPVTSAL